MLISMPRFPNCHIDTNLFNQVLDQRRTFSKMHPLQIIFDWEIKTVDNFTLGKGQHPYCPVLVLQQVWPVGHWDWPPGHMTFSAFTLLTGSASISSIATSPFSIFTSYAGCTLSISLDVHLFWSLRPIHLWPTKSHVVPCGQQCMWSAQHIAWNQIINTIITASSLAKVPIRFPPLPLGGFRQVLNTRLICSSGVTGDVLNSLICQLITAGWTYDKVWNTYKPYSTLTRMGLS